MSGDGGYESLSAPPRPSIKPGTLLVGTAGFHYPDWIGPVFPAGAGRGGRPHPLALLSRWVDLLEVNVSFYRIPSPEMATGWLTRTAGRPGFRFTAKLWRGFTHGPERASRGDLAAYLRFLRALEADGRLDAVLVQLPPSFRASSRTEAYVRRLRDHLEGRPIAVEPRDVSWDREDVRAAFTDSGIAWVSADLPEGPRSVPNRDHVTAPLAYLRLHGRSPDWYVPRIGRDRRYDHLYGPEEVRGFAVRIAELRRRAERVVVVANNHPSGKALVNAIELRAATGATDILAPASLIETYPRLQAVAAPDPLDPRAAPRVDGGIQTVSISASRVRDRRTGSAIQVGRPGFSRIPQRSRISQRSRAAPPPPTRRPPDPPKHSPPPDPPVLPPLMCPVRLSVIGPQPTRVPVVEDPFWIGRDPGCDLCLWDLRVSRQHAKLVQTHGEYMLSSEGRNGVFLNGTRVPVISLRHNDSIQLTPPDQPDPVTLRFENALEGTFVAAGDSLTKAWFELEKDKGEGLGLVGRYELKGLMSPTPDGPRLAVSLETGLEVVLKEMSPVPVGAAADAWLRFITAVAGANHGSLGRVVDGGVCPSEGLAQRWLALVPVQGRDAALRIAEGPQPLLTVVSRTRTLATALHLLHSRGVVHGGVVPENVILRPDGGASLVGYGRAFLRRDGWLGPVAAAVEIDYLAPELLRPGTIPSPASDVFGLVAVAFGMATGRPPFERGPEGVRGPRLELTGGADPVPTALSDLFSRALAEDPVERPTAEDVGHALAYVEATLRPSS